MMVSNNINDSLNSSNDSLNKINRESIQISDWKPEHFDIIEQINSFNREKNKTERKIWDASSKPKTPSEIDTHRNPLKFLSSQNITHTYSNLDYRNSPPVKIKDNSFMPEDEDE